MNYPQLQNWKEKYKHKEPACPALSQVTPTSTHLITIVELKYPKNSINSFVVIWGDFPHEDWKIPHVMTEDKGDCWGLTLHLPPGTYHYKQQEREGKEIKELLASIVVQ
jgi:hypothetical protein